MDKTTQYNQGYSIGCATDPLCPVTDLISDNLAFVDYEVKLNCKMVGNYGNSYYCTCKDRIQYFKNFGK
jgi:hypothetical protein